MHTMTELNNILRSYPSYHNGKLNDELLYQNDTTRNLLHKIKEYNDPHYLLGLSVDFDASKSIQNLNSDIVRQTFQHASMSLIKAMKFKQNMTDNDDTTISMLHQVLKNEKDSSNGSNLSEAICSQISKRILNSESSSTIPPKKRKRTTAGRKPKKTTEDSNGHGGGGTKLAPSSTKASSCMVDSRTTVARAILCATANVAFSTLTPDDENEGPIDYLDVPQNMHYNKNKQQKQENEDDNPREEVDEEEHNFTVNENGNNTSKNIPPVVNMGAVMMQAKPLGNRASVYALTASKRARERYIFELKSARQQYHQITEPLPKTSNLSLPFSIPNPFGLNCSRNEVSVKIENEYKNLYEYMYDDPYPKEYVLDTSKRDRNRELDPSSKYWTTCLERMRNIIYKGMGNMILYDVHWEGRMFRIADFLRHLVEWGTEVGENDRTVNYGPHLIVTTVNDLELWEQAFATLGFLSNNNLHNENDDDDYDHDDVTLRALIYHGSSKYRRKLRRHLKAMIPVVNKNTSSNFVGSAPSLCYTKDAPFHIVVMTYKTLLQDLVHISQIPWQVTVMDDGLGWLGAAHHDPNGKVGRVWDGLWSKADGGIGMSGASTIHAKNSNSQLVDFDFYVEDDDDSCISSDSSDDDSSLSSSDSKMNKKNKKKSKISQPSSPTVPVHLGISSRHRILIASSLTSTHKGQIYPSPVPALLSFLIPPFFDVTREEWDRSKVYNCTVSMKHYRSLLARSVVTYIPWDEYTMDDDVEWNELLRRNQTDLAKSAMEGQGLFDPLVKDNILMNNKSVQNITSDRLITSGNFMQSRKFAATWLSDNLSAELSKCSLDATLATIRQFCKAGYVCEEIVASPIHCTPTVSGISSNIIGNMKCAVRCGRTFPSEQGLRQHMAAMHGIPGTWLCRSCGIDCGTSQARTHHERYCSTGGAGGPNGGAMSKVGQVAKVVGKQDNGGSMSGKNDLFTKDGNDNNSSRMDNDGSFCVPNYRGVWINQIGLNFVKIDEEPIMEGDKILQFESAEEAAKHHDLVVRERGLQIEINYREDGTRIIYEDKTANLSSGGGLEMLGGNSVVPALSIINIKDLPKDVKPLLRDPRQTSRAGGNSKRYVYAYRGVCRQARKGHDRWQSQVSYGGNNHYLGTFDSEWDAAAIYAWAHLILYGKEATLKAQKEGEEAVAAYEKEKKDIAEGKIVEPTVKKKAVKATGTGTGRGRKRKNPESQASISDQTKTKKTKGPKPNQKKKVVIEPNEVKKLDDETLIIGSAERINSYRSSRNKSNFAIAKQFSFCLSLTNKNTKPRGCALLQGLSASEFGWQFSDFVPLSSQETEKESETFFKNEYGPSGYNQSFRCMIQGTTCILGRQTDIATDACKALNLNIIGGSAGSVDCNVGGPEGSCSENAARIDYYPTGDSQFIISATNETDIVTLNGSRIRKSLGSFPIRHEDIFSVGTRVFAFLLSNKPLMPKETV